MTYYHATSEDNAIQIINDGEIKTGIDGIVYMADSLENALKFVLFRSWDKVIIFEFDIPDESLVHKTFDHSYKFFQCKSYGYPENIDLSYVKNAWQQDMKVLLNN